MLQDSLQLLAVYDTFILLNQFRVLLTVHLGIILINNQLEAQLFFRVCIFQMVCRFGWNPNLHT